MVVFAICMVVFTGCIMSADEQANKWLLKWSNTVKRSFHNLYLFIWFHIFTLGLTAEGLEGGYAIKSFTCFRGVEGVVIAYEAVSGKKSRNDSIHMVSFLAKI